MGLGPQREKRRVEWLLWLWGEGKVMAGASGICFDEQLLGKCQVSCLLIN